MPAAQNDKAEIREIEPFAHCQSTHAQALEEVRRAAASPGSPAPSPGATTPPPSRSSASARKLDGLRIDPCIPANWTGFTATRNFRGHNLHIEVTNPSSLNRGVSRLSLDGEIIPGNLIPAERLRDGLVVIAEIS